MQTTKRTKALLIALVVVGWGAIGANVYVYLNFFKKPSQPNIITLDTATGQIKYLPK